MDEYLWPLFGLAVTTPRLTMRYVDDELAAELARLAVGGIHDPATMPFAEPWTDADSPELEHNTLRYYWRSRAETSSAHWDLNLAVCADQAVVGMCSVWLAAQVGADIQLTGIAAAREFLRTTRV